jgi:hypothetical protein
VALPWSYPCETNDLNLLSYLIPIEATKLKSRKIEKRTKPSCWVADPILPEITFYLHNYTEFKYDGKQCIDINNKTWSNQGKFSGCRMAAIFELVKRRRRRWRYQHSPLGLNTAKRRPTKRHQESAVMSLSMMIAPFSSPGSISSPESRSSPVLTNRTSLCLRWCKFTTIV